MQKAFHGTKRTPYVRQKWHEEEKQFIETFLKKCHKKNVVLFTQNSNQNSIEHLPIRSQER